MWLMRLCWMKAQLLQKPCNYVTGTVFKSAVKSQQEVILEFEGIYPSRQWIKVECGLLTVSSSLNSWSPCCHAPREVPSVDVNV